MIDSIRSSRCERVRARAAVAPDGELSALELRLVDSHLARCGECRAFAEDVAWIVSELRAARPARPERRFAFPPAYARRRAYARVQAVAAVAAVAAAAFGIALRAPLPSGGDGVSESLAAPLRTAADDVQIRQLQREALLAPVSYADRPSRSFGDQPA